MKRRRHFTYGLFNIQETDLEFSVVNLLKNAGVGFQLTVPNDVKVLIYEYNLNPDNGYWIN
jgi:hypothetical protein